MGVSHTEAEKIFGVSHSYYYALSDYSNRLLSMFFPEGNEIVGFLVITKGFIRRCVLALLFYCRAPIEGIVKFFDLVIGHHVSKGSVYNITAEATKKAVEYDGSVDLGRINSLAVDEIFQGNSPMLTAVDLDSRFIVMIEPANDRSGDTWKEHLDGQKKRGLSPHNVLGDGGTGLSKGVRASFGDGVNLQGDVFHAIRGIGIVLSAIERRELSRLAKLYDLERSVLHGAKPREKSYSRYLELAPDVELGIDALDKLTILYGWLREAVGFTGYGLSESTQLCEWILDEMAGLYPDHAKLKSAIKSFRDSLPKVLAYLVGLRRNLEESANDFGVETGDFMLMYYQRSRTPQTPECQFIEERLYHRFGDRLIEARERLDEVLKHTHRASSMIENVNGCIRDFIDLKRVIPNGFSILIKLFFNTKKSTRSRKEGWAGTSALNRLTGERTPEFLDILASGCKSMIKV